MIKPHLVSLGEVLWDVYPDGEQFGGAPANFACHAALLGADVTIVSAVGGDRRGSRAVEILQGFGVATDLVQVKPNAATGSVAVELNQAGKPTFTIGEDSAWDRLSFTEALNSRIAESQAVYFGTLGQRCPTSRETIRQALDAAIRARIDRILDINLRAPFFDDAMIRDSVRLASILKLSDEELPQVCSACQVGIGDAPERSLRRLVETQGLDRVVMTRGEGGAVLVSRDGVVDQPGIPATVVDTVGAGDSFTAAFLLGMLRGETHDQMLRGACEVASKVCSHSGAVPALP